MLIRVNKVGTRGQTHQQDPGYHVVADEWLDFESFWYPKEENNVCLFYFSNFHVQYNIPNSSHNEQYKIFSWVVLNLTSKWGLTTHKKNLAFDP